VASRQSSQRRAAAYQSRGYSPDVAGHVEQAVAVRREAADRRGSVIAVLEREQPLPGVDPASNCAFCQRPALQANQGLRRRADADLDGFDEPVETGVTVISYIVCAAYFKVVGSHENRDRLPGRYSTGAD
jgi:hypothetical protein